MFDNISEDIYSRFPTKLPLLYLYGLPFMSSIFRLGQRLNIAYERTPENFLCEALVRSASHIGCTMVDFTTTESTTIEEIAG